MPLADIFEPQFNRFGGIPKQLQQELDSEPGLKQAFLNFVDYCKTEIMQTLATTILPDYFNTVLDPEIFASFKAKIRPALQ